ncbi:MAG: response regulator transcription factor [Mycoplasmoidaceae bacterium]
MKTKILMMYKNSRTLSDLKIELSEDGYEVDYKEDIAETMELIKKQYYDIIVVSLDEEYDSVLELIKATKQVHIFTHIIAYGHNLKLEDILRAYRRGINDYINAPLKPKLLKAKIDSLIELYELLNSKYFSNIQKYGDFVVDRDSNTIFLNNEVIPTTKIEYKIIRKLMRANGECVSKQDLLKDTWGYDDANSNNLEVFISAIRKKLDKKYLYNIAGKGYCLLKKDKK